MESGYPHTLRFELHKALDAAGVKYWVAQGITFWNRDDGCECLAYGYKADGVPKLAIKVVGFTDPEHAIAAAMGDADLIAENAKLREQIERLQPKDCEGNALDIADTVSMLRSEYDGDHEWDDVVVELALTKWGGDRWIVRGSKGEAWACDCTKTGYDEDAYEASDDVEPFGEPTLLEVENAKLRELVKKMYGGYMVSCNGCEHAYEDHDGSYTPLDPDCCVFSFSERYVGCWRQKQLEAEMRELGIEVD